MTMTNKQYKQAREEHEQANELDTFTSYESNGYMYYENRFMKSDDLKKMRKSIREEKKNGAIILDDFNGRAAIIPTETGYILKSYYTNVCEIRNGKFIKLWQGYSNTTLKHINAFCSYFRMPFFSKREWIETKTEV